VKYKVGLDGINDLMAHNLDFMFMDPVSIKEMVANGRLKALVITAAQPLAALPGLPGAADVGIKNMDLISWWSVHVPAKTPQPIVNKLTTWFNQIAASDDARKFLSNLAPTRCLVPRNWSTT
jgi:tripartite-type tricarboxylate transporter receptor subunit TctC